VRHGDTGRYEVDRARAEELEARRLAELALRRSDLDRLSLSLLLGADPPFPVRLREYALSAGPDHAPDPESLLERARALRPDLRAARAAVQRALDQRGLEARRAFPLADWQLTGGVRVTSAGVGGLLAVGGPLPLFDHNGGARTAAAAQALSARAVLTLLERQLALDLTSAARDLEGAADALRRFARPQVVLREATLRGARRLLAEGVATPLEVITAQRDLVAAQRVLAQVEHDLSAAAFRLRIAQGEQ
jgi:outer membrane protein TolC